MGETSIIRVPVDISRGFVPSTAETGPSSDKAAARDGRNMLWLGPGLIRSSKGIGAAISNTTPGDRLFIVNDKIAGVNGVGSVVPYRSGLYYYLTQSSANGIINVDGLVINGTGGQLRFRKGNTEFNAGLAAPAAAPVPTAGSASLKNYTSGATSCQLTRIRTSGLIDGDMSMNIYEESNGSPVSVSVAVTNQKIKFTVWPAAGSGLDAHDAWGVYVTDKNAGSIGGYKRLKVVTETAVAAAGRAPEFDWDDNELLELTPPTDNMQPPLGLAVAGLGGCMIILSSRGGTHYAPSREGFPGAFNPLAEANMSPPETYVGMVGRAQENELFMWTANSLQSFTLSGVADAPVYNRAIWPQTGIMSPMGGCFADRRFYCFIAKSGPARLGARGDPDTSFAQPIRQWLLDRNIDASKVAVGYWPQADAIVYAIDSDLALIYMQGLSEIMGTPIWCVPYEVNFNAGQTNTSLLTFEGRLAIGKGSGVAAWEEGSGATRVWYLDTARQDAPNPMDRKTLTGYRLHLEASGVVAELFVNDHPTTGPADFTLTDARTGDHYTKWNDALLNLPAQNYAFRVTGQHGGERLDDIQVEMIYTEGLRDAD